MSRLANQEDKLSKQKKNKILLIFFLTLTILLKQDYSFAAWEEVRAKTVSSTDATMQEEQIMQQEYDEDIPNNSDSDIATKIEKKFKNFFKKNKNEDVLDENGTPEKETTKFSADGTPLEYSAASDKTKNQDNIDIDSKNRFQLNADKVTYNDEEGNVLAKGHVEIIAKAKNISLKADTAILDKESQTIKLYDNVKIIKDGTEMSGEYLLVDLNEENILMDNPIYDAYSFQITAQEGYLIANDIQMLNGSIKSTKEVEFPFISRGFMRANNLGNEFGYIQDPKKAKDLELQKERAEEKEQLENGGSIKSYEINAKEIVLTSYKDHNTLQMKDADIFYKGRRISRRSDIEIISDKKYQTIETSSPEFGNLKNFGSYFGYGFVQKLPKGQTLKLMPVLAYSDSTLGAGLVLKHRAPHSFFEGGWNTASENLVVRGRYRFSSPLSLTYGRNAYMPEGFLGSRRSGYAAQLQYMKSYTIKDLDILFNQGFYAGVFSDYKRHNQSDAFSTTRFRYIADAKKQLKSYYNPEQDFSASLNVLAQGAATVYGTGDTVGILRFGPYISTNFKRWESNIGYVMAGIHGDSPFWFDKYRYGKTSIIFNEKFNFTDNFSLGFRLYVTPKKDNYEEDLLTECRFYALIGPRDLKVALSYDFVRALARMDFMFLIGSKSSKLNFEKLTTKNMDGSDGKYDFYRNPKAIKIKTPDELSEEL